MLQILIPRGGSILIRICSVIVSVCLRKNFRAIFACAWFITSQLSCPMCDRVRKPEAHTVFIGHS